MRILSILSLLLLFSATGFASDISITGDVRLRHEVVDDSATTNQATRQRVRARLHASSNISEVTSVGIGLATGTTDRRSTNQNLGSTFDPKSINLDTAYIKTEVLGADLVLGKFVNPLVTQSEIFWDSDVRPEGAIVSYNLGSLGLSSGYLVTDDNATNDGGLALTQVTFENSLFEIAGSYTASVNGTSKDRFINVNGAFNGGSVFGLHLSSFGEYNVNTEATTADTAWLVGVRTSFKGLGLQYAYREVEANSVNALLTDSDFGNGVGVKGSEINLCYSFNDVKVGATYFDLTNGLTNGTDYDRLQVDLSVKF